MDKRQIIRNYIWDNYQCRPGYYAWRKSMFMEYSYIHCACEDILYDLSLRMCDDPIIVIRDYISESKMCLKIAKQHYHGDPTSELMFETAIRIGEECLQILEDIK